MLHPLITMITVYFMLADVVTRISFSSSENILASKTRDRNRGKRSFMTPGMILTFMRAMFLAACAVHDKTEYHHQSNRYCRNAVIDEVDSLIRIVKSQL